MSVYLHICPYESGPVVTLLKSFNLSPTAAGLILVWSSSVGSLSRPMASVALVRHYQAWFPDYQVSCMANLVLVTSKVLLPLLYPLAYCAIVVIAVVHRSYNWGGFLLPLECCVKARSWKKVFISVPARGLWTCLWDACIASSITGTCLIPHVGNKHQ